MPRIGHGAGKLIEAARNALDRAISDQARNRLGANACVAELMHADKALFTQEGAGGFALGLGEE